LTCQTAPKPQDISDFILTIEIAIEITIEFDEAQSNLRNLCHAELVSASHIFFIT
jgi:hypothetical protein